MLPMQSKTAQAANLILYFFMSGQSLTAGASFAVLEKSSVDTLIPSRHAGTRAKEEITALGAIKRATKAMPFKPSKVYKYPIAYPRPKPLINNMAGIKGAPHTHRPNIKAASRNIEVDKREFKKVDTKD